MENASKALIIGGAILLAILIISLGILIYNQASSVVNDNAMSQVEITQFNTQFTQYQGNQRGSAVRALYQEVLSNNVSQDDNDRKVKITFNGNDSLSMDATDTDLPNLTSITTGGTYNITFGYSGSGGNKGLVNEVKISKGAQ